MGYEREKSKMGVQMFWLEQLGRWWFTDREYGKKREFWAVKQTHFGTHGLWDGTRKLNARIEIWTRHVDGNCVSHHM